MAANRNAAALGIAASFIALIVACVGEDATPSAPTSSGDGGTSTSSSTSSSSGSTSSSGGTSSSSGAPDGGCTPSQNVCNAQMLHACRADGTGFDDIDCGATGCGATPTAHCKVVVPSANGVVPSDLDGTGLLQVAIVSNATINADTGEIVGVRVANDANNPARQVLSGIAFHQALIPGGAGAKIGIFSFAGLSIADTKSVTVIGANAVALVSSIDINVLGILDARGTCTASAGGPGGGKGGTIANVGGGAEPGGVGHTNASDETSGGGGGGYSDNGGSSPSLGPVGSSPPGGTTYGTTTLIPLVGGSGGGRGGDAASTTTTGGNGGGGGGAIQLVAVQKITIGGGSIQGGVNAGGCGGSGAAVPTINSAGGGGGGGSGGAILIEAPTVKLDLMGVIAANGGEGGGGASGNNKTGGSGKAGLFATDQTSFASAIASGPTCGAGGIGGASVVNTSTTKGNTGGATSFGCSGGGGGGAGRIRINSALGQILVVNPDSAFITPRLGDLNSHGDAVTTQGAIATQ